MKAFIVVRKEETVKKYFAMSFLMSQLLFCQPPVGLKNVGNTCYQNSSLQCLYNIQDLTNFMLNMQATDYFSYSDAAGKPTLAKLYTDLVSNLRAGGGPQEPVAFCERAMEEFFGEKYRQEDAALFVGRLLDYLADEDVNQQFKEDYPYPPGLSYPKTFVNELFGIFFGSITKCLLCDEESIRYQVARVLPLAVRTEGNVPLQSLHYAFDNFIKSEVLPDFKCITCDKGAQKQDVLFTAPGYLVIQLSRFKQNPDGSFGKDDHPISIPLSLDLSKYYYPTAWQKNFAQYELTGITIHSGELDGGHYWAYVKTSDGQWFKCDDSQVSPIQESEVKKIETDGYIDYPQATPYVLYYKRTPQLPQRGITKDQLLAAVRVKGLEAYLTDYLNKKSRDFNYRIDVENLVAGINQGLLTEDKILAEIEVLKSAPILLPPSAIDVTNLHDNLKELEFSLQVLAKQLDQAH